MYYTNSSKQVAYVEKLYPNTHYQLGNPWLTTNCEEAAYGFKKMGYEVKGFHKSEIKKLNLSRNTIVKGTVRSVRTALNKIGVPSVPNLDLPDSLREFLNRKVWFTTLGEVRKSKKKTFIKPLCNQKGFPGYVFYDNDSYSTYDFPDNFPVLASEPVNFLAEWRVYVLNKKIVNVVGYRGDFSVEMKPKYSQVYPMIEAFKQQPVAYAMDIGYIDQNTLENSLAFTLYNNTNKKNNTNIPISLVEINDAITIGNYGIPKVTYARMIEARWNQIVLNNNTTIR
jgi:hypothetical protein